MLCIQENFLARQASGGGQRPWERSRQGQAKALVPQWKSFEVLCKLPSRQPRVQPSESRAKEVTLDKEDRREVQGQEVEQDGV